MSALALMVFSSCDNKNEGPNLDEVVEDGFFVAGPATGSDELAAKFMMTAGFNEVTKQNREGMYEKYIVLEAGKDFYLTLNEAGESVRYGADLQNVDLAERAGEAAYADNPKIVIRKGELKDGPDAPAMQVNETGLYHIVLDLNTEEDLEFPQIIVVPCQWGVRGINGDWGFKPMELNVNGNKYEYSINFQNMAASTFKFAYCDGWKITLDIDGNVKAETSLGKGLKAGPDNIEINPGENVTIYFTFDLAAGDHSKSFAWRAEGVNENYSPADFIIGVSGALHSSVGEWTAPEGTTRANYVAADSDPKSGKYVFVMDACPFKANAEFKFRKDGDWIAGNADFVKVEGVTVSGTDNLTFGSEAGVYKVVFTLTCEGNTVKEYKAAFTRTGDLPAEVLPEEPETPAETLKFIAKVNKALDWYDKYFYAWADGVTFPGWPGTKMDYVGEEGNYYVYSTMIPASLDGKELNFIINGGNGSGQTKDLKVTVNGETTVTVEASDKK